MGEINMLLKDVGRAYKMAEDGEQHVWKRLGQNPKGLRKIFELLDSSEEGLNDHAIDRLLGIKDDETEKGVSHRRLEEKYGCELFLYEGTPYALIRKFLHELKPSVHDIVYDLGLGYGRIPFYGALTTKARYKGVEIVPERVEESKKIKKKFYIGNVEFVRGNVLDQDYSDGTIFFLFSPFKRETLVQVAEKLREMSRNKKIKVVSLGPSNKYFEGQEWLHDIHPHAQNQKAFSSKSLRIFESK